MTQNVPKLRKISRIHKVIEQRAKGNTIEQIAQSLGVSEKTVDRDLKSKTAQDFLDELIQQQIVDINQAEDIETRLTYRSDLLEKLLPKKQEIKQDVAYADNRETTDLLKLIAEVDKRLTQTNSIPKNDLAEPIHTPETNRETNPVSPT